MHVEIHACRHRGESEITNLSQTSQLFQKLKVFGEKEQIRSGSFLHSRSGASRLVLNALIDVDHLPEDASATGRTRGGWWAWPPNRNLPVGA